MRYVSGIDSLDDEFDVKSDNIKCIFDVLIYGFAFIAFLLCMNFSYELFFMYFVDYDVAGCVYCFKCYHLRMW